MGIVLTALVGLAVIVCLVDPIWGICAYIAVIIFRPNEIVEGVLVPAIPIMIIMMSLAYGMHMGRITPRSQDAPSHKTPPLMTAMVVLLILHFIVFPSGIPLKGWFLGEFAPTILLLLYMTRHVTTQGRLHAALTTTSLGAAFISLDALVVHFLRKGAQERAETDTGIIYDGYGSTWNSYHLHGLRLMGKDGTVWGNPNDLGMVTNWAILGCLYYIKRKGSKILKLVAAALAAALAGTLFLTGSRGGQLQMGINLWMVFVGGKRKALGIFLLVVALAGALVVLPKLAPERSDAGESKDERTELLMAGFRLFKSYPIQGCGYLRFPGHNDFKSLFPHNVYVQALAETGLIGAGIFFAMVFFLRRESKKAVKYFAAREDVNMAVLAQCIGALQLSYSVFIMFSNQFMTYRFGLIMTMAMALFRTMSNQMRLDEIAKGAAGTGDGEVQDEDPGDNDSESSAVSTVQDVELVQDDPEVRPRRRSRLAPVDTELTPPPRFSRESGMMLVDTEANPPRGAAQSDTGPRYVYDPRGTAGVRPVRRTVAALAGSSPFKQELRQAYDARDHDQLLAIGGPLVTDTNSTRDDLGRGCLALALSSKITGPNDLAEAYFTVARFLADRVGSEKLEAAAAVLHARGAELGKTAARRARKFTGSRRGPEGKR